MRRIQHLLAGIVCLLASAIPAWAVTFTVNSTADVVDANPGNGVCETAPGNGVCTLRAAIQEANALPGADAIILPAGTYRLTITGTGEDRAATGDLDILDNLTITGAGVARTIIDGGRIDRVFDINFLAGQVTVNITGVTIQNGNAGSTGRGGAIDNHSGPLTLTNSTISGNTAAPGGGIGNFVGTVILSNSIVRDNTATTTGGGIFSQGTLRLDGSSIISNRATVSGGGIGTVGTAMLTNSTISGNTATFGGGISSSNTLTLTNSTVSNNTAPESGGGLRSAGTLTLTNSTISGNTATRGGAIEHFLSGTATLISSTMTNNTADFGSGINNASGTVVVLRNTIVANSPAGRNCAGPGIVSLGHNLDSGSTCGFSGPGDLINTNPLLGSLADNGGPP